jgi:hypothetical protein
MALDDILVFFHIDAGTFDKVYIYRTTDLGVTWEEIGDPFYDINANIGTISLPANTLSIDNNKNFIIVGNGISSVHVPLYIRRVAFGEIQTNDDADPYDVTAYSESEYNDLMVRSYFVEAGKVTNTGTACTTLIDQSASGQDATVDGSPTLDDGTTPTLVTLDGSDDAFNIPTTGLTTQSEGSIIVVAKSTQSTLTNMVTFSDATASDEFVSVGTSSGNKTNLSNNTNIVTGTTTVTDAFHVFVFTFQNGSCNVLQYVDGSFQLRVPGPKSITEGRFLDSFGGITNVSIGKRVTTSPTFSGMQLKHMAISAEPLGQEQIAKSLRYLADKYSITLVNYYQ